jgi:hypothetical protein
MPARTRSDNPESASSDPDLQDVQIPVAGPQTSDQFARSFQGTFGMHQVEAFDGRSTYKAADFLDDLRYAFEDTPLSSKSEKEKVNYAISRLRDKPRAWVRTYRNQVPPPAWLSNFDLFAAEFANRFDKSRNFRYVLAHIQSLRQTGSVLDYATEFQQDATALGWPDQPLIVQFEKGLKSEILDELAKTPEPTSLESYIQLALRIDDRLQQHQQPVRQGREPHPHLPPPKRFHPRGQPVPTTSTPSRGFAPATARDSGARPQARSTAQPRFRQLTDQEREHRRKNNLCMYCGGQNHIARDCTQRPPDRRGPARAFGATAATSNLQGNDQAQSQ